jgi:hypothetical protein
VVRTFGADFEPGSHEMGRSTIDLLLLRTWPSTTVPPAVVLSTIALSFSYPIWGALSIAVAGRGERFLIVVVFVVVVGMVVVAVVKLKVFSNSPTRSKEGMSKEARPGSGGRLLKPGERSTGAVSRREEGGGLGRARSAEP